MCKILIEKVSGQYPIAIQYLEGYKVEAELHGPFEVPFALKGIVASTQSRSYRIFKPASYWLITVAEIVRALREQRFDLVAYRFKKEWGEYNAFPLLVGDPGLVLTRVA